MKRKKRAFNPFILAYLLGLGGLAWVGYNYADYTLRTDVQSKTNDAIYSDVQYIDLPRMNLSVAGTGGSGNLRMDISLEVEKKYASRIEGYRPHISDRIINYVRSMDGADISKPAAAAKMREQLLEEAKGGSFPYPIVDVIFRQYVVM